MNKLLILSLSIFSILFFNACDKEEDNEVDYGYSARIMSPNADDKKVGDDIHLHVEFESSTGETIHNVNVKVYNKADNSIVLFDGPEDAHVHTTEGNHEVHADIALTEANKVQGDTHWIVEAKVWPHDDSDDGEHDHDDHEDGEHVVTETVEFHVHLN